MKVVSIFLLVVIPFLSFSQYDPKALSTLEAMSKKYKTYSSFEANVTSLMTNDVDGIKEEFKGKITVKGQKFKLDLGEQQVINNGNTVWTYLPAAKEVNIDRVDKSSNDFINPTQFYDMYKKGFKYLYLSDKTEGGVVCEEIDLVPEKKDTQYFKVKLFIAKKDKTIQSWTMYERNGNKYKYTITKFLPNVKVTEDFFAFDPKKHPGVEIVDLR